MATKFQNLLIHFGIASSYSGNTGETVSNVQALLSSQAKIVCITSGGALYIAKKQP